VIPELFVGITSWNSALFLPHCLAALARTTRGLRVRVTVADNGSRDDSVAIAAAHGAQVMHTRCSQADALNRLLAASDAPATLLLHADVVLLGEDWFERCRARLDGRVALVAPEDIGCGPCTRPFGRDRPESSFLFFDTAAARRSRALGWRRWHRLPLPRRRLDLYGEHVTHRLPRALAARGYRWQPMAVHPSPPSDRALYTPRFRAPVWEPGLAFLRYGLGNFYSLDGAFTHYHNWFDRVDVDVGDASTATTARDGGGFPAAYVNAYTRAFLADLAAGTLVLPAIDSACREPRAL